MRSLSLRLRALDPDLWIAMRDRGVDVRFFLHIEQTRTALSDSETYGNEAVRAVMDKVWSFGDPRPRTYYDARALKPQPWFNMHAKCVVVDGECALVTSARPSPSERKNTARVRRAPRRPPTFAHHLARQWLGLIDAGLVVEGSR